MGKDFARSYVNCFINSMELSEYLFVPAIGEANIYGNISQCFVVREHQIIRVGDRRKLRIKLGQFDIDPVIGSLICIFNAVVKCLAGCRAAFQVRETGSKVPSVVLLKIAG